MIWRISRRNSIITWQGYRVSASRLAESNFRYTQGIDRNQQINPMQGNFSPRPIVYSPDTLARAFIARIKPEMNALKHGRYTADAIARQAGHRRCTAARSRRRASPNLACPRAAPAHASYR